MKKKIKLSFGVFAVKDRIKLPDLVKIAKLKNIEENLPKVLKILFKNGTKMAEELEYVDMDNIEKFRDDIQKIGTVLSEVFKKKTSPPTHSKRSSICD